MKNEKKKFFFLFTLHSFILNRSYMFKTSRWNIPIFIFFNWFFFIFIFLFWTIFWWTWTTMFISIIIMWRTSTFIITFTRTWTLTMTTRFTITRTRPRWTTISSIWIYENRIIKMEDNLPGSSLAIIFRLKLKKGKKLSKNIFRVLYCINFR